MNLPQLRPDWAQHFVYGTALYTVGSLYSPLAGLALATVFGVGKEIYDKVSGKGRPGIGDAVFTVIAPLVLFAITYVQAR